MSQYVSDTTLNCAHSALTRTKIEFLLRTRFNFFGNYSLCQDWCLTGAASAGGERRREFSVSSVRSGCSQWITGRWTLHGLRPNENSGHQHSKNFSTEDVSWSSDNDVQTTTHQARHRPPPTSVWPDILWTKRRWWRPLVWDQWQLREGDKRGESVWERSLPSLLWTAVLTRQPALIFPTSYPNATFSGGAYPWGCDPQIRTWLRFLYITPTAQVSSFYIYSFGSYRVGKQTNKRHWKQWRLFVCLFVCQHDNFWTSKYKVMKLGR